MNDFVDLQLSVTSKKAPLLNKMKDKFARQINGLKVLLLQHGQYLKPHSVRLTSDALLQYFYNSFFTFVHFFVRTFYD